MEPTKDRRGGGAGPLRLLVGAILGVALVAILAAPFVAGSHGRFAYRPPPSLKPSKRGAQEYRPSGRSVDIDAIKRGPAADFEALGRRLSADVAALVSPGGDGARTGRMAGSTGAAQAAAMIADRFKRAGMVNVQVQEFPVTVPVTLESSLIAAGQSYPVHPFWPNSARTCTVWSKDAPGQLNAPLVYGGDGRLENLAGRDVADAILVLDNDRGLDWVTACSLGARAVIFLEPESGDSAQDSRVLAAALDIPRFWLARAEGLKLVAEIERERAAQGRLSATLKCRVDWQSRTARNVYGLMPGRNPAKQRDVTLVAVPFDSPSLVPDLAPGAEAAASLAAAFELIERLKATPPERPVLFLAVGAHYQAMLGDQYAAELLRNSPGKLLEQIESLDGPALGVDSRKVLIASGATVEGLVPWHRVMVALLSVVLLASAVLLVIFLRVGRGARWAAAVALLVLGAAGLYALSSRLARERKATAEEIARLQEEPAWTTCSYVKLREEIGKLRLADPELAGRLLAVIERREQAERRAILARSELRGCLAREDARLKGLAERGIKDYSPPPADWSADFAKAAAALDEAASAAGDFQAGGEDRVGRQPPALADYRQMRTMLMDADEATKNKGVVSRELADCLSALANAEERQKNATPGRLKYLRYCGYMSFLGRLGPDLPERVKSCVWLDLSSRAVQMGAFYKGLYVTEFLKKNDDKPLQSAVAPLAEFLAARGQAHALAFDWKYTEESPFVVDTTVNQGDQPGAAYPACPYYGAEMFLLAGMPSVTLGSAADGRRLLNTPMDLPERMDPKGLARQTEVAVRSLCEAFGAGSVGASGLAAIEKMESQKELRAVDAWLRISGLVTEYNPAKSQTLSVTEVEGALVFSRRESRGNRNLRPTYAAVRAFSATLSDRWGGYEFFGLPVDKVREWNDLEQRLLAFKLDPASGRIAMVLDDGAAGKKRGDPWRTPKRNEDEYFLSTFPCAALNIFEAGNLRTLIARDTQIGNAELLLGQADATAVSFGASSSGPTPYEASPEHCMVLFVSPQKDPITREPVVTRVKAIFGQGKLVGSRFPLLSVPGDGWEENPKDLTDTPEKLAAWRALDEAQKEEKRRALQAGVYHGKGTDVDVSSRLRDRDNGRRIPATLMMAQDLYRLDDYRLHVLDKAGVRNASLDKQHADAGRELAAAREAADGKLWHKMLASARAALQFEARVYPNVEATVTDVVKGLLFYLFLMLPFAYFVERLIFAFPDINRQLAGVFGVFMAAFALLFVMHPAFRITSSAPMILLSFITVALAVLVISMISSRFKRELEALQRRPGRKGDMDRFNAAISAFLLGINNMRRRKVRTVLTLVTLVLLTFSVLSFSSIQSSLSVNRRTVAQDREQPYEGLLIRHEGWANLDEFSYSCLRNEFGAAGQGELAPRAWLAGEGIVVRVAAEKSPEKGLFVGGVLGVAPQEVDFTGLGRAEIEQDGKREQLLKRGRWFRPEEASAPVCVLPERLAATELGLDVDAVREGVGLEGLPSVVVAGERLTVVGILADEAWRSLTDIDGESPVPLDYDVENWKRNYGQSSGADAAELRKYTHLDPRTVPVVPYDWLMGHGGKVFSVAVKPEDPKAVQPLAEKQLMRRLTAPVFVSSARDDAGNPASSRVMFLSPANASDVSGMGNLLVPMLIAALIVLNTMLGAVYEREKEISIYGALGLAPVHIGSLFIAESAVFAVVSAVLGYVLGQSVAKLAVTFPALSAGLLGGISLNYSSMSAVFSAIFIIAVVMLSAAYPAFRAGRLSVPDVERIWKFPEPDGDRLVFDFPFTVSGEQGLGVNMHLIHFFRDHANQSVGDFYTADTGFARRGEAGQEGAGYRLGCQVWIAPFDFGISQRLELDTYLAAGEKDIYETRMILTRVSGSPESWVKMNHRFMKSIRKQFLLWRLFTPEERAWHVSQARELLGEAGSAESVVGPAVDGAAAKPSAG